MENEHYESLLLDTGEFVLDTLLSNNVLKEIPVLSSVVNLFKGTIAIRDRLFAEKLKRFLDDFDSLDEKEKQKIFDKMKSDPDESNRVGKTTLIILERISEIKKAHIIAMLFISYGLGHLPETGFRRLSSAVDLAFIDDLEKLISLHKTPENSQENFLASLVTSGLTEIKAGNKFGSNTPLYYQITRLGNQLCTAYHQGLKHSSKKQVAS